MKAAQARPVVANEELEMSMLQASYSVPFMRPISLSTEPLCGFNPLLGSGYFIC